MMACAVMFWVMDVCAAADNPSLCSSRIARAMGRSVSLETTRWFSMTKYLHFVMELFYQGEFVFAPPLGASEAAPVKMMNGLYNNDTRFAQKQKEAGVYLLTDGWQKLSQVVPRTCGLDGDLVIQLDFPIGP